MRAQAARRNPLLSRMLFPNWRRKRSQTYATYAFTSPQRVFVCTYIDTQLAQMYCKGFWPWENSPREGILRLTDRRVLCYGQKRAVLTMFYRRALPGRRRCAAVGVLRMLREAEQGKRGTMSDPRNAMDLNPAIATCAFTSDLSAGIWLVVDKGFSRWAVIGNCIYSHGRGAQRLVGIKANFQARSKNIRSSCIRRVNWP